MYVQTNLIILTYKSFIRIFSLTIVQKFRGEGKQ